MPLRRSFNDLVADAKRRIDEIDADELAALQKAPPAEGLLVIDVRESEERATGYIPGTIHISRGTLERDIEKKAFGGTVRDADLGRTIVCACAGGSRSALTADVLKTMGFTRVLSLRGGFKGWAEAGLAVTVDRR